MDPFESEFLSELRKVKYRDLEDLVYRLQLTYEEIIDILDENFTAGSIIGYTLPPNIYEINDINLMLKSLLPGKVKLNFTIDGFRKRPNLTTNKTKKPSKNFLTPY